MTHDELREAQEEMKRSADYMAKRLGISERSYYYRLSGDLPIRNSEAIAVKLMLSSYRMQQKRKAERKS